MACHSLRHDGEELLGRGARPRRARRPVDVGHPAAAPVGEPARRLRLRATTARSSRSRPARRTSTSSSTGCRCTGCARAVGGWEVLEEQRPRGSSPAASSPGCAEFPFDHRVEVAAELVGHDADADDDRDGDRRPAGADRLRLPPVPAAPRRPARRVGDHAAGRRPAAARRSPGPDRRARRPRATSTARSATRTFDDGFTLDALRGPFVLAGGGRRIEVAFESGYPYAQVFAPAIADVICFEPMTAPADALRNYAGRRGARRVVLRALQRQRHIGALSAGP